MAHTVILGGGENEDIEKKGMKYSKTKPQKGKHKLLQVMSGI